MRNLFLPRKYSELLRYKPNQLDFLESLFFKYIPLDTKEYFQDIFLTPKLWRRKFEQLVIDKSPKELSIIAIKLCLAYFKFEIPDTKENIVAKALFENYIYGKPGKEMLFQELSNLLLLSYHYYASPQIKEISFRSKQSLYEKIYSIREERYNNISNYKRNKSTFMYLFLTNKENNRFSLENQKIYDLDFINSMTSSTTKSSNPFAMNKCHLEKTANINLSKMLEKYTEMLIDSNQDTDHVVSNDKILKHTTLYNHFILERLSCINFLNAYMKFTNNRQSDHIHFKTIQEYAICPLLNFRAFIPSTIDIFYTDNPFYETITEFDYSLNHHLKQFLNQLTTCILPILDITFRYLISLQYHIKTTSDKTKSTYAFREHITTTFDKNLCDISATDLSRFFKTTNRKATATKCDFADFNNPQYPSSFYIDLFYKIASKYPKITTVKKALLSTHKEYINLILNYQEEFPLGIHPIK